MLAPPTHVQALQDGAARRLAGLAARARQLEGTARLQQEAHAQLAEERDGLQAEAQVRGRAPRGLTVAPGPCVATSDLKSFSAHTAGQPSR